MNNAPGGADNAAVAGVIIIVAIIGLVIGLTIAICFLMMLSKALQRCAPENRTMEPGQVWLNLIPCFNIVWQFITVNRIAESLDNEFYARGWRSQGDFGKSTGTTYCVLNLLGWIPYLGVLLSLAGLACFIMYWVKIAGYSKQLDSRGGYSDYDDDEYDDEYDDRPRKKKKRRQDDDYDDERDDR